MDSINVKLNEFPTIQVGLGNTIVNTKKVITSHTELEDRDLPDQHPASAITGIEEEVAAILTEAKESGEFDGKDGASVTVESVTESAADGGSNVVTFSDGKTLTVKNGNKGADYVLTDDDKAELAQMAADTVDVPAKLPNPNTLIINGTAYDGSSAVRVNTAKEPLIGSTDEITPNQVADAVAEGRPVCITHEIPDETYLFTSFNVMGNLIIGEILYAVGENQNWITAPFLRGQLGADIWQFAETPRLARIADIPDALKNPNALTINGTEYDGSSAVTVNISATECEEPDFSANEGEVGYIKNRTHYVDGSGTVHKLNNKFIDAEWMATIAGGGSVLLEKDLEFTSKYVTLSPHWFPTPGIAYDIYWNGTKYSCTLVESSGEAFVGNRRLLGSSYPDTGEPFLFTGWSLTNPEITSVQKTDASAETVNLRIETRTEYNKLPEDFLPDCVVKTINGKAPDSSGNVTVDGASGSSASIDVAAEVGQTIVIEEIDADGKPVKWKAADYQPRTHWTDEKVLLTEAARELDENGQITLPFTQPDNGIEYRIVYNGVEYILSEYFMGEESNGDIIYILGNIPLAMETGDNGIPFIFASILPITGDSESALVPLDGSTTVTLSVTERKATPIPSEYVTNAYPYYIEIDATSPINSGDPIVYTCTDTVANVQSWLKRGRTVLVRFRQDTYGDGNTVVGYVEYTLSLASRYSGGQMVYGDLLVFRNSLGTDGMMLILTAQEDGTYAVTDSFTD